MKRVTTITEELKPSYPGWLKMGCMMFVVLLALVGAAVILLVCLDAAVTSASW